METAQSRKREPLFPTQDWSGLFVFAFWGRKRSSRGCWKSQSPEMLPCHEHARPSGSRVSVSTHRGARMPRASLSPKGKVSAEPPWEEGYLVGFQEKLEGGEGWNVAQTKEILINLTDSSDRGTLLRLTFDESCDLSTIKIVFHTGNPWISSTPLGHSLLVLAGLCLGNKN